MSAKPPVVSYRPEPSVGLFIGCTLALLALAYSLATGDWLMREETGGALLLVWPLALIMLVSGRKRLVIARDDAHGCLRVELRRWPLASRVTTHPLAEIRDVIVEVDPLAETLTHRVALVLASGEQAPLTASFCSGRARHERAAAEIRALLLRR